MKFKIYICTISLLLVLLVINSHAEVSLVGESTIDIANDFGLKIYGNDLSLNKRITCVAVDSNGNVAVKSGSTDDHCDYIISVYSKNGVYLYGFEVKLKYMRGAGTLFFDSKDRLCDIITYSSINNPTQRLVVVYEPNSVQYKSYALEQEISNRFGNINYVNNVKVFVSAKAPYSTSHCTEYSYVLKDNNSANIYLIYDRFSEYSVAKNKQRTKNILGTAYVIIHFVVVMSFVRRCQRRKNT